MAEFTQKIINKENNADYQTRGKWKAATSHINSQI